MPHYTLFAPPALCPGTGDLSRVRERDSFLGCRSEAPIALAREWSGVDRTKATIIAIVAVAPTRHPRCGSLTLA